MSREHLVRNAANSLPWNLVLQFSIKGATFCLTAILIRFMTKEAIGIANIRLQLLLNTVLFLAREPFRRAVPAKDDVQNVQSSIFTSWLSALFVVVMAAPFGYLWIHLFDIEESLYSPTYSKAVMCYLISAFIEISAEPVWLLYQMRGDFKTRIKIEGFSVLIKTIVGVVLAVMFTQNLDLLVFGYAQLSYSIVYCVCFYVHMLRSLPMIREEFALKDKPFRILPTFTMFKFLDMSFLSLTWNFFKQSILKQLLTEGEKYMMTIFDVISLADQGVYDVVNNLGSLAPRLIFLPFEETAYTIFSQVIKRGESIKIMSPVEQKLIYRNLTCLLKASTMIGIFSVIFGTGYCEFVLYLYAGSNYVNSYNAVFIFRLYCFYVALLAFNGITEAFMFASLPTQRLSRYNLNLLAFSILFMATSYLSVSHIGSAGFVMANSLNMMCRIYCNVSWINSYYKGCSVKELPLRKITPKTPVISAFFFAFCIINLAKLFIHIHRDDKFALGPMTLFIVIGLFMFCFVCRVILWFEKDLVSYFKHEILHLPKDDEEFTTASTSPSQHIKQE